MRWNRYQRRVLAVGLGLVLFVVGRWFEGPRWRPLGVSPGYGPVDGMYIVTHRPFLAAHPIAGLLWWVALASVWAAVSLRLVRERS